MLQDILYHAYNRSVEVGRNRRLAEQDYNKLFQVNTPDISRSDNESLARSARDISQAMLQLNNSFEKPSKTLTLNVLRTIFRFSGNPLPEEVLEQIISEGGNFEPQTVPEQGPDDPPAAQ